MFYGRFASFQQIRRNRFRIDVGANFPMAKSEHCKAKQSATDDLYNIVLASKSTQKDQQIYRLIGQLAVMAAANSKTEMTPTGHVFPYREPGWQPQPWIAFTSKNFGFK